jgi:fatty-acyl-CoA synthase
VPFFHCFGCVIGVLGAYTHAASLVPLESFDALRVLQYVERERCTALYGVPTMFIAELEQLDYHNLDLSSLRTGVMAGALCSEPLMRKAMERMNLMELTIAYGLTEASPGITLTPRNDSVELRTQTVGRVLPEVDVKIVDPFSGEECQFGIHGELCCRGYNVMKGYYNNPNATREAIDRDGWLHTGDQATLDSGGYVRITGRIKELIIRGGENIAPKEVEDLLRQNPKIADVYVYGIADEKYGEEVAAAIRLKPGESSTQDEIQDPAARSLRRFVSYDGIGKSAEVQAQGEPSEVILPTDDYEQLIEDLHLARVYEERRTDARIPWEQVKEELIAQGKLKREVDYRSGRPSK